MSLNLAEVLPAIDFNDMAINFAPTYHRTPRFIAWLKGLISGSNSWLFKNFWNYYYGDSYSNFFIDTTNYNLNDTVVTYGGVYISTVSNNLSNKPDVPNNQYSTTQTYYFGNCVYYGYDSNGNPNFYQCNVTSITGTFNQNSWTYITGSPWYKIAPSYVGAKERSEYCSQKLIFEYALNRLFRTNFNQPTSLNNGSSSGKWYLPTSDIWIQTVSITEVSFLSYDTENSILGGYKSSISFDNGSELFFTFDSYISASNSTFQYIVWIPTSLSIALGSNYVSIVSQQVNNIGILGTSFKIEIY